MVLLIKTSDEKWIEANDFSSGQHFAGKNLRFENSMLRSNLCDYSDAYIVIKGKIKVRGTNDAIKRNKKLTFKNNAPFRSCISKINNAFIDDAEDLGIVMPMYNLLEYSGNYFMTSESLCYYYRDEVDDDENENDNNNKINKNKTITSQSFEYKTKLIGSMPNNSNVNAEVVVPLKYLSNFWRSLNLSKVGQKLYNISNIKRI